MFSLGLLLLGRLLCWLGNLSSICALISHSLLTCKAILLLNDRRLGRLSLLLGALLCCTTHSK